MLLPGLFAQSELTVMSFKTFLIAAGLAGALGGVEACAGPKTGDEPVGQEETSPMAQSIEAAQQRLTDSVMSLPGVVGTAIGECEGAPCIKVYVVKQSQELADKIPSTFEGFTVVVEVTGEIRARDTTDR